MTVTVPGAILFLSRHVFGWRFVLIFVFLFMMVIVILDARLDPHVFIRVFCAMTSYGTCRRVYYDCILLLVLMMMSVPKGCLLRHCPDDYKG
jgi:hypothetical protein